MDWYISSTVSTSLGRNSTTSGSSRSCMALGIFSSFLIFGDFSAVSKLVA